jgi:acyl-CoA hydrolase
VPTVPPAAAAAAAAAAVAPGNACVAAGPEVTVSSCVPTGPILSLEKELMEQWRTSNHLLIPHFAKMEQAKSFNASLDRSAPPIPS